MKQTIETAADRIVELLAATHQLAEQTVLIRAATARNIRVLTITLVLLSAGTLILLMLFALAFWRYAIVVHL